MERARVLCPSLSLGAHLAGAAILATATLVVPGRLPAPAHGGFERLGIGRTLAVSLGGGALRGSGRTRAARAAATPARVRLPLLAARPATSPALDPGSGRSVPGLDDLPDGPGRGFCLVDCGTGPGDGPGDGGSVLPALEARPQPAPVRVGGDVRPPLKLVHVAPVYPALATAARVQGSVVLDCVIDEDGRVA
ncbi:MAG: energy transducer TonB, partial [Betaproteobacteria bacterium]